MSLSVLQNAKRPEGHGKVPIIGRNSKGVKRMVEKKSTAIYEDIKKDIISGKIDSRSFLNVGEISDQYHVSKAPVRDALQLLCDRGFLISFPRKGFMVNLFSNEEVNKIQAIRRHMEKYSVQLAVENATDEEINSLREFTREESRSLEPGESNNVRFHLRLAEIGHNEFLPQTVRDLVEKVSLANIKAASDFDLHDKIIDALLARDLELAVARMEEDVHDL